MNLLRIGFLSAAGIGRKNWKGVFHSGKCVITAVASRDVAKARSYIEALQTEAAFTPAPVALGSYEELLASKNVDAVYIPLPTGLRKEWVIRAARAGKHVICEKPCATSAADLEEMLATCRQHKVQFLDGVMFMHSHRLGRIREVLDDGTSVGDIKRITSQFSFLGHEGFFDRNIRVNAALEPAGCAGDLGWYNIRFALWTLNWRMPREIAGRMLAQTPEGVPTDFSGELIFDGGVSAGFYCSFMNFRQQWANVSGTKGYLQVPDFVNPFSGGETGIEVFNHGPDGHGVVPGYRRITVAEHGSTHPTAPEANMFRNFASQVFSGQLNDAWPRWSLKTQMVLDECLKAARKAVRS